VVTEWRLPGLVAPAELLACELTTNAVHAARRLATRQTPVVRLEMVSDGACVVICVWDGNDQMPARRDAGPDEDSGRGLMLVEALAKDWGAYRQVDGGKVVWVMLAADP
jgi:anti-sigma regulatory factor (Ser/Thr protein kinase)